MDTSAFPALNPDMAMDIANVDDIRRGLFGKENEAQRPSIPMCEATCPICNTAMYGVSDAARDKHILKCAKFKSVDYMRNEKASRYQEPRVPQLMPTLYRPATVIAVHTFDSTEPGDLLFEKGEIITIVKRTENKVDWWTGRIGDMVGIFPSNFTKPM